jgi:hypothetical protein
LDKYKACLVTKGYAHEEGIDYEETFSPSVNMVTFWLVISIVAHFGWKVYQMDVKSVFWNGDLNEEAYLQQPQGFQLLGKKHLVS